MLRVLFILFFSLCLSSAAAFQSTPLAASISAQRSHQFRGGFETLPTRRSSSTRDAIDDADATRSTPQNVNDDTVDSGFTNWSSSWFPLAFAAFTDKHHPTQHWLLGAPIVVWHFNNTWHAMLDKCPHRLVPLSEGRVLPESGNIECPYHGFTFEGTSGKCTRVPQSEKIVSDLVDMDTRGCATALPCVVQQGIIWVHSGPLYGSNNVTMTEPNHNDLKRFSIDPIDRQGVLYADYFRDLHMDWSTLAENVVDPAHLPFTHDGTISSRSRAVPVPIKVVQQSKNGFVAKRLTNSSGSIEFRAPHLIYSTTVRNNSFTDWNVVYAIPTTPNKCRLLVRVVFEVSAMKFPLKQIFGLVFRQPKFLLHLNNHKVLEDDNIFLHHQGYNYAVSQQDFRYATYLPTSADRAVIAFHKWLDNTKECRIWSPHTLPGAFLQQQQTMLLPRDVLIEREHSHTRHCTSCSRAKKWLERIEPALTLGAVLSVVKAFRGNSGNSIIQWPFAILASVFYGLKQKATAVRKNMQDGMYPPPRNR